MGYPQDVDLSGNTIFLEQERPQPLRHQIRNALKPVLRSVVRLGWPAHEIHEHEIHFRRCIDYIRFNGVVGDIFEFGVGGGSTLAMINNLALQRLSRMYSDFRLFGFDSFQGMPASSGFDAEMHGESDLGLSFAKGEFSSSIEAVWKNLRESTSEVERITLVEGWYEETLTAELKQSLGIQAASLINIDCDLYSSTRAALAWSESLIQQGTILNFDDWFCYKGSQNHGEARALSEFLAENPHLSAQEFSTYSWHGKAFLISRGGD